jgi:subtilisin family serine protease
MPARRLVVAAASGVAFQSVIASAAPAAAAKNSDAQQQDDQAQQSKADRKAERKAERQAARDASNNDASGDQPADTSSTTEATRHARSSDAGATTTTTAATKRSTTSTTARATTSTATPEQTDAALTPDTSPAKRYIVVLKNGNQSSTVAKEQATSRKLKVLNVFGHALRGYAADIPADQLDAVRNDPRVAYVEEDKPITKSAQILPWGVEKVSRSGDTWSSTRPGDGSGSVNMDVYVIDTGIERQPDLNGGTDVNFRGGPNTDCDGHGTHMAGIVGAADNTIGVVGVAPSVRVHGVKVLDCTGKGTDVNAIAGLDWVVQNGAHPSVITMSFGGPISQAFDDAVRRAVGAGFTIITAAGNDHKDACSISPAHMGELDGVITVGASTKGDGRASFSNYGKCVDMYAPGVRIPSLFIGGNLASATGTSASAPHVAGVAALLKAVHDVSPPEVEAALKSKAVNIGSRRHPVLRVSAVGF